MTWRAHADPTFAGYRNAVAALWCRVQQTIRRCADCGRVRVSADVNEACRCGAGEGG